MNFFHSTFGQVAQAVTTAYMRACPSTEALRQGLPKSLAMIIQECFGASLTLEEQQQTRVRLVCAPESLIRSLASGDYFDLIRLEYEDSRLNAQKLRKLSPALAEEGAAIWVWDSEQDNPVVLGVLRRRRSAGHTRPHDPPRTDGRATLTVSVEGPGCSVFGNLHAAIADFRAGTFFERIAVFDSPTPFRERLHLIERKAFDAVARSSNSGIIPQATLAEIANPTRLTLADWATLRRMPWNEALMEWQSFFRPTINSLLKGVLRHGAGGTLVLGGDGDTGVDKSSYSCLDNCALPPDANGMLGVRAGEYLKALIECDPRIVRRAIEVDRRERDDVESIDGSEPRRDRQGGIVNSCG